MNTITISKYHYSDIRKDEEGFKVSIEPGYYNSPYSLCTSINTALAPTPLKINFHEKTKRFYFTGDDREKNSKCVFEVGFSRKLLGVMGNKPELLVNDIASNNEITESKILLKFRYQDDDNNSDILLCDTFSKLNRNSEIHSPFFFPSPPNLNFSISPWIFIYCNIIEPSITGHSRVSLLKIVPLSFKDFEKGHALEFETLEFARISLHYFQSLQFEIRNHDGTLLNTDDENLMLTLLLQKD